MSNPNTRLYISTKCRKSVNSFARGVSSGEGVDGSRLAILIGLGAESRGWSKCAIAHTRTSSSNAGDTVFLIRNSIDSSDCNMGDKNENCE